MSGFRFPRNLGTKWHVNWMEDVRCAVDCSVFNNDNAIASNRGFSGNFVALLTCSFCILIGVVVLFSGHKINGILCRSQVYFCGFGEYLIAFQTTLNGSMSGIGFPKILWRSRLPHKFSIFAGWNANFCSICCFCWPSTCWLSRFTFSGLTAMCRI